MKLVKYHKLDMAMVVIISCIIARTLFVFEEFLMLTVAMTSGYLFYLGRKWTRREK